MENKEEMLKKLREMKKELARKQRKLEKSKRAARVKAHVRQKIKEHEELEKTISSSKNVSDIGTLIQIPQISVPAGSDKTAQDVFYIEDDSHLNTPPINKCRDAQALSSEALPPTSGTASSTPARTGHSKSENNPKETACSVPTPQNFSSGNRPMISDKFGRSNMENKICGQIMSCDSLKANRDSIQNFATVTNNANHKRLGNKKHQDTGRFKEQTDILQDDYVRHSCLVSKISNKDVTVTALDGDSDVTTDGYSGNEFYTCQTNALGIDEVGSPKPSPKVTMNKMRKKRQSEPVLRSMLGSWIDVDDFQETKEGQKHPLSETFRSNEKGLSGALENASKTSDGWLSVVKKNKARVSHHLRARNTRNPCRQNKVVKSRKVKENTEEYTPARQALKSDAGEFAEDKLQGCTLVAEDMTKHCISANETGSLSKHKPMLAPNDSATIITSDECGVKEVADVQQNFSTDAIANKLTADGKGELVCESEQAMPQDKHHIFTSHSQRHASTHTEDNCQPGRVGSRCEYETSSLTSKHVENSEKWMFRGDVTSDDRSSADSDILTTKHTHSGREAMTKHGCKTGKCEKEDILACKITRSEFIQRQANRKKRVTSSESDEDIVRASQSSFASKMSGLVVGRRSLPSKMRATQNEFSLTPHLTDSIGIGGECETAALEQSLFKPDAVTDSEFFNILGVTQNDIKVSQKLSSRECYSIPSSTALSSNGQKLENNLMSLKGNNKRLEGGSSQSCAGSQSTLINTRATHRQIAKAQNSGHIDEERSHCKSSNDEANNVERFQDTIPDTEMFMSQDSFSEYTELDAIPYSHFELTEDFLSEAMPSLSYQSDSNNKFRAKYGGALVKRRSLRISSSCSTHPDFASCSSSSSSIAASHTDCKLQKTGKIEPVVRSQRKRSLSQQRKAAAILSVFQYLIDEAKKPSAAADFELPEAFDIFKKWRKDSIVTAPFCFDIISTSPEHKSDSCDNDKATVENFVELSESRTGTYPSLKEYGTGPSQDISDNEYENHLKKAHTVLVRDGRGDDDNASEFTGVCQPNAFAIDDVSISESSHRGPDSECKTQLKTGYSVQPVNDNPSSEDLMNDPKVIDETVVSVGSLNRDEILGVSEDSLDQRMSVGSEEGLHQEMLDASKVTGCPLEIKNSHRREVATEQTDIPQEMTADIAIRNGKTQREMSKKSSRNDICVQKDLTDAQEMCDDSRRHVEHNIMGDGSPVGRKSQAGLPKNGKQRQCFSPLQIDMTDSGCHEKDDQPRLKSDNSTTPLSSRRKQRHAVKPGRKLFGHSLGRTLAEKSVRMENIDCFAETGVDNSIDNLNAITGNINTEQHKASLAHIVSRETERQISSDEMVITNPLSTRNKIVSTMTVTPRQRIHNTKEIQSPLTVCETPGSPSLHIFPLDHILPLDTMTSQPSHHPDGSLPLMTSATDSSGIGSEVNVITAPEHHECPLSVVTAALQSPTTPDIGTPSPGGSSHSSRGGWSFTSTPKTADVPRTSHLISGLDFESPVKKNSDAEDLNKLMERESTMKTTYSALEGHLAETTHDIPSPLTKSEPSKSASSCGPVDLAGTTENLSQILHSEDSYLSPGQIPVSQNDLSVGSSPLLAESNAEPEKSETSSIISEDCQIPPNDVADNLSAALLITPWKKVPKTANTPTQVIEERDGRSHQRSSVFTPNRRRSRSKSPSCSGRRERSHDVLKFSGCFQSCSQDAVVSLLCGELKTEDDQLKHYIVSIQATSLTVWTEDDLGGWTTELDWRLAREIHVMKACLLPRHDKIGVVASGWERKHIFVSTFVYDWNTEDTARFNIPITEYHRDLRYPTEVDLCPYQSSELHLGVTTDTYHTIGKVLFSDSLSTVQSSTACDLHRGKLINVVAVKGQTSASVSLTADQRITIWNMKFGVALKKIKLDPSLPCLTGLLAASSHKGFLTLDSLWRVDDSDFGGILLLNPLTGQAQQIVKFQVPNNTWRRVENARKEDGLITAVNDSGLFGVWNSRSGALLGHTTSNITTCACLMTSGKGLLLGEIHGCLHIYSTS